MSRSGTATSIADCLRVQMRVIGALIMRELHTRFGRENLGYIWLFAEPAMLGGSVTLLHLLTGAHLPNGIPPLAFYIVAYTPFYMLRAVINRAASGIVSNSTLLYHRMVTIDDILLSRTLLEGAACLFVTAVFTFYVGVMDEDWPEDPIKIVYGILLILWWAHAIGMAVAALGAVSELAERFVHPAVYIFLPLSGAFYMSSWLSPRFAELMWWNPVVQMYELIRDGQFGDRVTVSYSVAYMLAHCIGMTLLGYASTRAVRPKVMV